MSENNISLDYGINTETLATTICITVDIYILLRRKKHYKTKLSGI